MSHKPSAKPEVSSGVSPAFAARRKFLNGIAAAAGGGAMLTFASLLAVRPADANPAQALRPPGALDEATFLSACVRCGLCVRDCPYDTLVLAPMASGVAPGTPYFSARDVPCEMCDDIPCVKVCPTGALNPKLIDIHEAKMGLAVLSDQETCLNFLGLRCDVCYRVCPVIDKAITLEHLHNPRSDRHAMLLPTVHSEHCTGCGKCERACVLPEAAIKIMPIKLAKGALPEHYRKGWEEKAKHGGSLIGDQVEMPVRGLEGKAYGDSRVDAPASSGLNSGWKP